MKRLNYFHLLTMVSSFALLLSGCVIKPASVPTRHFVLAPISAPEHQLTTSQPLAIEVGFVKMPSYLLRDSMVVRKSAEEVQYLETALWAERLDQSFRHTLVNNLSLLAGDRISTSTSERGRVGLRLSVDVQQFDVNTEGRGTLVAQWHLTDCESNERVRTGGACLHLPGRCPSGNPQAIATTLSALLEEFSRELVPSFREFMQAGTDR